jgi:hypothetical protein
MFRSSRTPAPYWRLNYTVFCNFFAFPVTSDTLTLLAIICDILSVLCGLFATPAVSGDVFAISGAILRFLIVTSDRTQSSRPSTLNASHIPSLLPDIPQIQSKSSQTLHHAPSAVPIAMPARGDLCTPHFDPRRPRELRRYFADLTFLFARSHIADDQAKKGHACQYVDIDTADLWESLREFSDGATSFADFAHAIYRLIQVRTRQDSGYLQIWRD